jgi:alpha-ketoglutarate-dependent taurine dioxygenase
MTMSVEPLSPALGAEIKGVDLRRPLDDATVRAINAAFDEHVVVVFRDQELSEADQLRAAGYFGKVHIRRRPANGRTPGGDYDTPFMMVTNIVEDGKSAGVFGDGEMWFHHDTSYYPQPHRATFLYSIQLTSRGGETCFSNMYKAYENIPRALRDRLEGRNVLQVHGAHRGLFACGKRGGAGAAVRHRRRSGDRLRARMAARRSRGLGQLVLDSRAQGFSARGTTADAPLHHRGPGAALLT